MPIVNDTPQTPPTPVSVPIRTARETYRTPVVDTRYIPESHVIAGISGRPYTVDWYSQVVDDDSALRGQDLALTPTLQPYELIKGMVLKVTQAINSPTQDAQQRWMSVRGTAIVYPCLRPNNADMFVADVGDGRAAVFQVTGVTQLSIYKDTCHEIEYQIVSFLDQDRKLDLEAKVVKTWVFVNDFMMYGQNPFVEEEEAKAIRDLSDSYTFVLEDYIKRFNSVEYKTLLVPDQTMPTYDPMLLRAFLDCFSVMDDSTVQHIKELNTDEYQAVKADSIWMAIVNRNEKKVRNAFRKYGLIHRSNFDRRPQQNGFAWSGVSFAVVPRDPAYWVDAGYRKVKANFADEKIKPSKIAFPNPTPGDVPDIHPILIDDNYVLSEAFYTGSEIGLSKLEILVRTYLSFKKMDTKMIVDLVSKVDSWPRLEQFYYTPILMMMIKAQIRSF